MPHDIAMRFERNRLSYLIIELMREIATSLDVTELDAMGVLVGCAVCIGHTEDRPMSATKISHFLGVPRTTVIRKLERLIRLDIISRRGHTFVIAPARRGRTDVVTRLIRTTLKFAPSIMDGIKIVS